MAAIVAQKVKKNRLNTGSTPRQSGVAKDPVKLTIVNGVVQEASGGQYPDKKKGDKAAHPHSDYYRKIPQDPGTASQGTAGPGQPQNWPPRRPRQKKADEQKAQQRKRNKIEQLDGEDGVYRASSSANVVLYVGLGMIAIGLVITFVGLGDKGFRTLELKLIGPSLVGCGVFFALLRVLFCTVPSCCRVCMRCCKKNDDTSPLLDKQKGAAPKNPGPANSNAGNGSLSNFGGDHRRVAPSSSVSVRTGSQGGGGGGHSGQQQHPNFVSDEEPDSFEKHRAMKDNFRQKHIKTAHGRENLAMTADSVGGNGGGGPHGGSASNLQNINGTSFHRSPANGRGHTAKPLVYDKYSSSSSSDEDDFSIAADILAEDGNHAAGVNQHLPPLKNKMRVVASPEHYPDFSKLPPLPVLGSVSNNLASPGRHEESVENGDEAVIVDAGPPGATAAAAAEVLLNASRLKVESET